MGRNVRSARVMAMHHTGDKDEACQILRDEISANGPPATLESIARLRTLLNLSKDSKEQHELAASISEAREKGGFGEPLVESCCICMEAFAEDPDIGLHLTMCWHLMHTTCIDELKAHEAKVSPGQGFKCPSCRAQISAGCTIARKEVHVAPGRAPRQVLLQVQVAPV